MLGITLAEGKRVFKISEEEKVERLKGGPSVYHQCTLEVVVYIREILKPHKEMTENGYNYIIKRKCNRIKKQVQSTEKIGTKCRIIGTKCRKIGTRYIKMGKNTEK